MFIKRYTFFSLFLLGAIFTFTAEAAESAESDESVFKFGGFGTLGASHSSQNQADYVLDSTIPNGPGRSYDWATGNDSKLGVQLTGNFTPKISAVFQVISEYQYDGTYTPGVEWANVKYAFTPSAYIRVGRIDLPTFLYSDSRKIGYSYPWVHPPAELYRQLTITSSDGVDAMYRFGIGEAENSIKAIYGQNKLDRVTSISSSKELWGVFDTIEYGSALFRVGYQQRESSSYARLTGVTGAWGLNKDYSAALSYDPGNWFAVSEWLQRESTTRLTAWSVSAGLHIDKFTPYFLYSQSNPASILSAAPTANAIQSAKRSQSTNSLGLRWDFMKNTDVNLQLDQVHLDNETTGYLTNVVPNATLNGAIIYITSFTLDFVF